MSDWTIPVDYKKKIEDKELKISVVGLGYVGLPLATMFASKGFDVTGYDTDKIKVEKINKRKNYLPEEKWLTNLLKEVETFSASTNVENAGYADFISICVPTPSDEETKKPVYDYVEKSSEMVGKNLIEGSLVSLESTVGPGTTEGLVKEILETESGLYAGEDFGLVYSPERINPGDEKHKIDTVPKVVGGIDDLSTELGSKVYEQIVPEVYSVKTPKEAELTKLLENIQRDVNMALINEFAQICDLEKVDIKRIIKAASTKWNFMEIYPGCGVGGHCLPQDPYFLIQTTEKKGYSPQLIKTAREINEDMPGYTVRKTCSLLEDNGRLVDSKVGILGIAYKENINDARGTPTKRIVEELKKTGIKNIIAHDPFVSDGLDCKTTHNLRDVLKGSDAIIIATAHKEYEKLGLENINQLPPDLIIVDGRNIFDPDLFKGNGIKYTGIGR